MFILGSVIGSFLCCQARRIDLKAKATPKTSTNQSTSLGHRSVCLHCHHRLAWYENIPIFSWLFLRGKCKKCHKKIGVLEFLSELGLGVAFLVISVHFLYHTGQATFDIFTADFPNIATMGWLIFAMSLILVSSLAFLGIYDGMSGKLPVVGLTISAICAILLVALEIGNDFLVVNTLDLIIPSSNTWPANLLLPAASAVLFGGIYLMLYVISKGAWVGDGDWILAGIIGLALGHPWLATVALFIANLSACIIMYPIVKNKKKHQIYFGPFLVLAFVVVYSFSDFFLSFLV